MEKLQKTYHKAVRIVGKSESVVNASNLLTNDHKQIFLNEPNCLSCQGKGYVALDFGNEMCGGIRILTSYTGDEKEKLRVRIRFGESLSECYAELGEKNATNDHSPRDIETIIPILSGLEFGNTGFRFVRIDFLDEDKTYRIKSIVAFSLLRDLPVLGTFECSDERVNEIFKTAQRTVHLCCQDYIWDGIKRDRLVWVGDMQPEILAALDSFGSRQFIKDTVLAAENNCPLPAWFGVIPTYSAWYIQIVSDIYLRDGDSEFAKRRIPYINGILKQFLDSVDEKGHISYVKNNLTWNGGYFIDWPSSESKNLEEGNRALLIYVLLNAENVLGGLGLDIDILREIVARLEKGNKHRALKEKQLAAFQVLSKQMNIDECYPLLTDGRGKGMSTFMSSFILSAVSEKSVDMANSMLKEYYGGMLDAGATSFWEDFDLSWMNGASRIDELPKDGQKDIHGDNGKYCYVGFRHSLCHGWSAGPVQYLLEKVAGFHVLEPGCRKVAIEPNIGSLTYLKASYPTPFGAINLTIANGSMKVDGPRGIEIITKK